ncbi:glycine/betaine ABC transporter substrate-binding protein [Jannaschia sp.]|nr:glycine/betaine ABC transporter substrate-binding protein [Jannaschia sp.]
MKNLTIAASLLALTAGTAAAQDQVTISDLNWNGATAIANVLSAIIEGPMGSDADIVQGMNQAAVIMEGMDKGDGSVDIYTDLWMPNQQALWDEYVDNRDSVAVNKPYQGTSNIYVPTYMADQGITSIEDLNDPEVAAMFDTDGNGKGEYWAGDVTWASTKRWQIKFKSYGLDALWEPNIVSADTFKAGLEAAYSSGDPQLFYYWTPEAIHVKYDLTALEEPARFDGCEEVDLDAENWLEVSSFDCVIAANDIFIGYSKSLEERNPAVATMLSNVQFTGDEINEWIVEMFENKRDPRIVAEEWVEDNSDIVDGWING